MGKRPFIHDFVQIDDVYWAKGTWDKYDNPPGSDVWAYENGYVAITPIQINRTNYDYMDRLRGVSWVPGDKLNRNHRSDRLA
jgi:5'-nucleotidase